MEIPGDLRRYLEDLVDRLRAVLGDRLVALYGLGGLAFGDYRPGSSDLDVYAVVRAALEPAQKLAVADSCSHGTLPCPARRLELVVISAGAARAPGRAPRWELNLNTGAGETDHVGLDPAAESRHWFVLDLAIAHQRAFTLLGPAAPELIGSPDVVDVRLAQSDAIAWYARAGMHAEAVNAACRAWHWHETGCFAGKRQALRWAAGRLTGSVEA